MGLCDLSQRHHKMRKLTHRNSGADGMCLQSVQFDLHLRRRTTHNKILRTGIKTKQITKLFYVVLCGSITK